VTCHDPLIYPVYLCDVPWSTDISGIFMWHATIHWYIRYIYVTCHDPLIYPVYLCDVPWSTEIFGIFMWHATIHWNIRYIYVTCHDPLRYPVYLCDVPWSTEISGIFMWRAMIHWDIRYIYVTYHDPLRYPVYLCDVPWSTSPFQTISYAYKHVSCVRIFCRSNCRFHFPLFLYVWFYSDKFKYFITKQTATFVLLCRLSKRESSNPPSVTSILEPKV